MRKKWLSLLVAGLLVLTACGNNNSESGQQETNEDPEENITQEEKEEKAKDSSGNEIVLGIPIDLGDYVVTIQNYKLGADQDGKDALIVEYDWVNESEESAAPFMTFSLKAFQDGVETDDVFMVEGVDLSIGQKEVKPGGSIQGAQDVVGISDINKPLELEIEEAFSFSSKPYTTVIDLSTLK